MTTCPTTPECPSAFQKCALPSFTMDCETGLIDMKIIDCEVKTDCQINSAIIMALFVKGRDERSDTACKGGWFGGPIGSRLWTLEGKRLTNGNQSDIIRTAEQYLEEALAPLVSQGIIDDVTVNASANGDTIVIDDIIINQPSGATNFAYLWEQGCA